ncbi:SIMPL domain-containing protein [Cohnella abietis]|uniref:SIMPL domain-containing protein n=1 Tax=Cohnella abietis TaxID=2507935 RepID=A0A3T1CZ31_9BACL|nr:SIMPL domain-containing protein [Cohnella abietis]BBI31117.1 hypothetical protein KCTCHS21_05160 [Cohnella abietis]
MGRHHLKVLVVAAAVVIGSVGLVRGGGDIVSAQSVPAVTSAAYTITVGATGTIKVEPDVAYLSLAVESQGSKALEAQQANADKFAAVEKTLYEKFSIDKKDVKTTGFGVQPDYDYTEKEGRVLKGYVAVHSVQVTYRKITEIGKLLDALTASGANRLDGVQFGTEKNDQYELEALKKAMANASKKANVLAASSNRKLKGVLNVVQGDVSNIPIVYGMEAAKAQMSDMLGGSSTSVQTGQIEIRANVTVQYEMK